MKRALAVGIDFYDRYGPLFGCVNDVRALEPLLRCHDDGSPNFETAVLVAGQEGGRVTRDELLSSVERLLGSPADQAVLYFAGHGVQVRGDVALVTSDATDGTPGLLFAEVMSLIENSPVREIIVLLDCCFAGGAGRVPMVATGSLIRAGLSVIAASRDTETSAETAQGRGQFSSYLEGALDGGAAEITGEVSVAGAYAYVSEAFGAWEQRPTFKSNIERVSALRRCTPLVQPTTLRNLAVWFPDPLDEFALDPSYEDTAEPRNAEHEAIFKQLQQCSYAKLVEPVDEDYMYYAAMNSTGCRLTALGRRYHRLASNGRI